MDKQKYQNEFRKKTIKWFVTYKAWELLLVVAFLICNYYIGKFVIIYGEVGEVPHGFLGYILVNFLGLIGMMMLALVAIFLIMLGITIWQNFIMTNWKKAQKKAKQEMKHGR